MSCRLLMIAIITWYAFKWVCCGRGQLVGTSAKRLIRSNSLPTKLKDRDIDLPSLGECIGCGKDMYNSRYCTHFNCPTIKHYMHHGCAEKWCNQPNSNGRCPTCRAEATTRRWSQVRQSVITRRPPRDRLHAIRAIYPETSHNNPLHSDPIIF